jgi:hypothetical protein
MNIDAGKMKIKREHVVLPTKPKRWLMFGTAMETRRQTNKTIASKTKFLCLPATFEIDKTADEQLSRNEMKITGMPVQIEQP